MGEETQILDERDACVTSSLSIRFSLAFKSAVARAGWQSRRKQPKKQHLISSTIYCCITTSETRIPAGVVPSLGRNRVRYQLHIVPPSRTVSERKGNQSEDRNRLGVLVPRSARAKGGRGHAQEVRQHGVKGTEL